VRVPVIPNAVPWPVPDGTQRPPAAQAWRAVAGRGPPAPPKGFRPPLAVLQGSSLDGTVTGIWRLWVRGSERGRLQAMIGQLGLEDRVHLHGGESGTSATGIALLTSSCCLRASGFSVTLVERWRMADPSVSFDCDTGPRDIIRHGVDGILVPSGDTERLGMELRRLMDNPDERSRLGTHAREIRTRFSIDRVADMWESLFDDALGSSRVRR
jgi:glycosyltransferase involved in cell wall biosynthesis